MNDFPLSLDARFPLESVRLKSTALIACLMLLAACSTLGIPVIDLGVQAVVTGKDEKGQVWRSTPEQFTHEALFVKSPASFPATVYHGEKFHWRFFAESDAIGSAVRSALQMPICFRFDQATLSSNMQLEPLPLRIKWSRVDRKPVYTEPNVRPFDGRSYAPIKQCFGSEFTRFDFGPDLIRLFPNDTMFNVKLSASGNTMAENGRGNWLNLTVPIEYGDKREQVTITLTAIESAVRKIQF